MLIERLRAAIRASPEEPLAKAIRIETKSPTSDHLDSYLALLAAIDAGGLDQAMIAGWWQGWSDDVTGLMSGTGTRVELEAGTDLDWLVWRASWSKVVTVVRATNREPGLLASPEPGWVLFSPPSSNDMFLYPEVSASSG